MISSRKLVGIARVSTKYAVVKIATSNGKPAADETGANKVVLVRVRFWRIRRAAFP